MWNWISVNSSMLLLRCQIIQQIFTGETEHKKFVEHKSEAVLSSIMFVIIGGYNVMFLIAVEQYKTYFICYFNSN